MGQVKSGVGMSKPVMILSRNNSGSQGPNQAEAKVEHIVVVGSQGGKKIERKVARSYANLVEDFTNVSGGVMDHLEYYQDPLATASKEVGACPNFVFYDSLENEDPIALDNNTGQQVSDGVEKVLALLL